MINYRPYEKNSNWIEGDIDGQYFSAKYYDEPSQFGIKEGRVSKLYLQEVCHYDRGWDEKPNNPEGWMIMDELVDFLENEPKRNYANDLIRMSKDGKRNVIGATLNYLQRWGIF